jgi:hypothetical protein
MAERVHGGDTGLIVAVENKLAGGAIFEMEQGNRLKALEDLQKVQLICGNTTCEEYRQLKAVIDGNATY